MTTEKKIVSVTPADGSAVRKTTMNTGRPGFGQDVIYALEDGSTVPSHVDSERKGKLPARIASENQAAVRGELFATFIDGEFWGTKRVFDIGGRRTAPAGSTATAVVLR